MTPFPQSTPPQHVAIIMDGNGRWAQQRGHQRTVGHRNGVQPIRDVLAAAAEVGVKYLTLYAFSTENWNRPKDEVDALMLLLVDTINSEVEELKKNNIRLAVIGNISLLPSTVQHKLAEACRQTASCDGLALTLALSYSAHWEIVNAAKKCASLVSEGQISIEGITADFFEKQLSTVGMPNPELLIRTSGEKRISNFLLWQLAYTELYFTDVLWPDFGKKEFLEAIEEYQLRERRFGKISEQL